MHIKKQQEVDLPHVVREELWSDSATFVNITGSFCVSEKCHGVGLGEVYQVQCGSVSVWHRSESSCDEHSLSRGKLGGGNCAKGRRSSRGVE